MGKCLKLFMVALFATLTCALTSCSDDKDEPSNNNVGKQYSFNINDTPYYYGVDFGSEYMTGRFFLSEYWLSNKESQKTVVLITYGQPTPINFDDTDDPFTESSDELTAYLQLALDYFDPNTTKKGVELSINNSISNYLDLYTVKYNEKYSIIASLSKSEGKISFVSYEPKNGDYEITVKLENLTFYERVDGSDQVDMSKKYVINGEVTYPLSSNPYLP